MITPNAALKATALSLIISLGLFVSAAKAASDDEQPSQERPHISRLYLEGLQQAMDKKITPLGKSLVITQFLEKKGFTGLDCVETALLNAVTQHTDQHTDQHIDIASVLTAARIDITEEGSSSASKSTANPLLNAKFLERSFGPASIRSYVPNSDLAAAKNQRDNESSEIPSGASMAHRPSRAETDRKKTQSPTTSVSSAPHEQNPFEGLHHVKSVKNPGTAQKPSVSSGQESKPNDDKVLPVPQAAVSQANEASKSSLETPAATHTSSEASEASLVRKPTAKRRPFAKKTDLATPSPEQDKPASDEQALVSTAQNTQLAPVAEQLDHQKAATTEGVKDPYSTPLKVSAATSAESPTTAKAVKPTPQPRKSPPDVKGAQAHTDTSNASSTQGSSDESTDSHLHAAAHAPKQTPQQVQIDALTREFQEEADAHTKTAFKLKEAKATIKSLNEEKQEIIIAAKERIGERNKEIKTLQQELSAEQTRSQDLDRQLAGALERIKKLNAALAKAQNGMAAQSSEAAADSSIPQDAAAPKTEAHEATDQ